MSRAETKSAAVLLDENNPFSFTLLDERGEHHLSVEEPENFGVGSSAEAQNMMRSMMISHLLATEMPGKIETNFDFHFPEILYALYEYYGRPKPRIIKSGTQEHPEIRSTDANRGDFPTATSHSGGLDSVYRIAKLLDEGEVPLAVHLRNLNHKGNAYEASASEEQCRRWNVPYVSVRLRNSSGNSGFDTMKTRDLLLAMTVVVEGAPENIKRVLIEGGMGNNREYHFSESAEVWNWFNQLLKENGIDVEVVGVDPGDVETIGEIIDLEKKLGISILPMVQNCFSAPYQIPNTRKKWVRETPNIAKYSSDHWCGSCHKCRRLTLGRLVYEDPRFKNVSLREIEFFVKDTYKWLKTYQHNSDLISESFMLHLQLLEEQTK